MAYYVRKEPTGRGYSGTVIDGLWSVVADLGAVYIQVPGTASDAIFRNQGHLEPHSA